jgi:hypothetical protein
MSPFLPTIFVDSGVYVANAAVFGESPVLSELIFSYLMQQSNDPDQTDCMA